MIDSLQPPTDNLYKFIAIGGLALALVAAIFLFREQASYRERYINAQVELIAGGYVEGSGIPQQPELRRPYAQREYALKENEGLLALAKGWMFWFLLISCSISVGGFRAWWHRIQKHDDIILRLTAEQMQREAASRPVA